MAALPLPQVPFSPTLSLCHTTRPVMTALTAHLNPNMDQAAQTQAQAQAPMAGTPLEERSLTATTRN